MTKPAKKNMDMSDDQLGKNNNNFIPDRLKFTQYVLQV
jgi:hypothetical protein